MSEKKNNPNNSADDKASSGMTSEFGDVFDNIKENIDADSEKQEDEQESSIRTVNPKPLFFKLINSGTHSFVILPMRLFFCVDMSLKEIKRFAQDFSTSVLIVKAACRSKATSLSI